MTARVASQQDVSGKALLVTNGKYLSQGIAGESTRQGQQANETLLTR